MVKALTREQVQSRKDKAVRFTRDVLGDPDRADEIADESLESYAERRGFTITNPGRENRNVATKRELEQQVQELEEENQELQDQLDVIADIVSADDEDSDTDDDGCDDEDGDETGEDEDNQD
jgi:hypothetical protein